MSIINEIQKDFEPLSIPVTTGAYKDTPPDVFVVAVPMDDTYEYSDDKPWIVVESLRLSLSCKGNYSVPKKKILKMLFKNDYTVMNSLYTGFDSATGYHQYIIDIEKSYEIDQIETEE